MFSRACCMLLALGLPLSLAQSASFPKPKSSQKVSATIPVSGVRDGGLVRYYADASKLGDGGQAEGQKPIFELADGATLKNVIIGAPAADGIHCKGSCTLENIYWEDIGEDAATFKGGANSRVVVNGGGAKNGHDKTFQHNGGGSVTIKNFYVSPSK
ncbi:hypothetical protein AAVH_22218 [Aphelenchoides avenae]|nr:hypothetical protein AAVH_22218 [Aphelenchus avenae]